jgi:putative membrane protein
MKTFAIAAVAGLLLMSTNAFAQEALPGTEADAMYAVDTPTFVKLVSSSNEFEIQSSELAEEKGQSDHVKEVAAQIIADHSKAAEDLAAALEEAGKAAPPEQPVLSPKHQAMIALLEGAEGTEFEMLYVDMQAVAHMEAVSLFQTFAKGGDNEAVQAFAAETLPTLVMHLDHVKEIVASM